jgi:hypothetical protein
MKKEFVPYELAMKLKELGFDEPCFGFYQLEYGEIRPTMVDDNEQYRLTGYRTCKNSEIPKHYTSAPTFSQCFRWFREKYNLCVVIKPIDDKKLGLGYNLTKNGLIMKACTTYETAELACLDKLIEIVENEKTL